MKRTKETLCIISTDLPQTEPMKVMRNKCLVKLFSSILVYACNDIEHIDMHAQCPGCICCAISLHCCFYRIDL